MDLFLISFASLTNEISVTESNLQMCGNLRSQFHVSKLRRQTNIFVIFSGILDFLYLTSSESKVILNAFWLTSLISQRAL